MANMCIHNMRAHTHTYLLLALSKAYEIPLVVKISVKISALYSSVKDENRIAQEIEMWWKKWLSESDGSSIFAVGKLPATYLSSEMQCHRRLRQMLPTQRLDNIFSSSRHNYPVQHIAKYIGISLPCHILDTQAFVSIEGQPAFSESCPNSNTNRGKYGTL